MSGKSITTTLPRSKPNQHIYCFQISKKSFHPAEPADPAVVPTNKVQTTSADFPQTCKPAEKPAVL